MVRVAVAASQPDLRANSPPCRRDSARVLEARQESTTPQRSRSRATEHCSAATRTHGSREHKVARRCGTVLHCLCYVRLMLKPGSVVGSFEILSPLGAGGMGEVWRARDSKLHRDVAIKVLTDALASDPERLVRFQREAQTLASLNHPNIAAIYDLQEDGGTRCLVLELVEGRTLAERLRQGPLPIDEVLQTVKQVVDALEAAHEKGI